MLGCDIRNLDEETLALIKNETLIRINQDPDYRAPIRLQAIKICFEDKPVYFRVLPDNEYAIGLFNTTDDDGVVALFFAELGAGEYLLYIENVSADPDEAVGFWGYDKGNPNVACFMSGSSVGYCPDLAFVEL
jgi:hypothetical protein